MTKPRYRKQIKDIYGITGKAYVYIPRANAEDANEYGKLERPRDSTGNSRDKERPAAALPNEPSLARVTGSALPFVFGNFISA
ncbi:hypothetical protein J6590_054186 [Homalodisca vitripennis]|nr:hypothetical protein J6590_054186 [Homalodisca vitripennis]